MTIARCGNYKTTYDILKPYDGKFVAWDLECSGNRGLRYSSDAAEVVPKGIGTRSYSSGVAQFESVNASVDAGAWFIEQHDDFLYNSTGIYNSTDNSTTTIDDGTIVATIGMALSGKVGSTTGPFEGPLMCQDFAGNPTAACRVNPMARIYGSDMDIPGVNSLEGCLESCRVRSFATVSEGLLDCVGVEWFGGEGRCVILVDVGGARSFGGGAVKATSGETRRALHRSCGVSTPHPSSAEYQFCRRDHGGHL